MKKILILWLVSMLCIYSFVETGFAISLEEVNVYLDKTVIVNFKTNYRLMDGSNRITYVGKILQIYEDDNKEGKYWFSILLSYKEGNTGYPTYSFYSNQKVKQILIGSIFNIKEF